MKKVITIPKRITQVTSILGLGLSKMSLSEFDECDIVFTSCEFGKPLPMLILGREIRALIRNNGGVKFMAFSKPGGFRGYADHVGFFRYCGFLRGKELGEAAGSPNYIPITLLDLDDLKQASGDRPYAEILIEKSNELTSVLMQQDSGTVYEAISYSIREILRNTAEHSQSRVAVIFGQCWPAKKRAEIAIFDTGIGLNASLTEAGLVDGNSDLAAIMKSMEPGVTGVSTAEREFQDETFRNSGFGLYVTSKFFSEVGFFRILSGDSAVTVNSNGVSEHTWSFQGTCILMSCDLTKMDGAGERILKIIEEGEEASGGLIEASTASKRIGF